ncbi:MAG: hypothetical protein IJ588_08800 [Prevotella sp.]|nr:hypothetical protein [Prevotella sp.]
MTLSQICKSVRLCIDEEAANSSSLADADTDSVLMDHIIEDKIADAMRWVCLHAPAELLGGSDENKDGVTVSTGILVDAELRIGVNDEDNGVKLIDAVDCTKLIMPDNFIKLARVRALEWHKAVRTPISEDSDEYLQLYDDAGATATPDRPVAAIIDKAHAEIELWPSAEGIVQVTFVASTGGQSFTESSEAHYPLPPLAKTAFIYYLAFLLLSAYNDPRAARMLEIAKMNLGKSA